MQHVDLEVRDQILDSWRKILICPIDLFYLQTLMQVGKYYLCWIARIYHRPKMEVLEDLFQNVILSYYAVLTHASQRFKSMPPHSITHYRRPESVQFRNFFQIVFCNKRGKYPEIKSLEIPGLLYRHGRTIIKFYVGKQILIIQNWVPNLIVVLKLIGGK